MDIEKERAAFEAFETTQWDDTPERAGLFERSGQVFGKPAGEYQRSSIQTKWEGWRDCATAKAQRIAELEKDAQTVRNAALEEAAQECWKLQCRPEFEPEFHDKMLKIAEDRIRALKEAPRAAASPLQISPSSDVGAVTALQDGGAA